MVFCGQCGLQLSPGMMRCPRCGAETEVTDNTIQPARADSPTIEATYIQHSPAITYPPQQEFPATPLEQQKLVLRPDSNGNYDFMPADDNEQTRAMNAPDYASSPGNLHSGGYSPSHATTYPTQSSTLYQSQERNLATPAFPQSAVLPPGGTAPTGYPPQQKRRRGGGILTLLIVVGLLLVLGISGFFVVQRSHLLGNTTNPVTGGTNSGGTTQNPAPITPVVHARAVVQHYYAAINNKNYPEAYSLWRWSANGPTLTSFENGYANTEHDALTIRNATQLGNGTVRVVLVVIATESVNGTIRHHTYAGYYDIGQVGGTWKIFRGYLNRV